MQICPDCGQALIKVAERLYQCEISKLYYPLSTRGKLGYPLTEPPPSMIDQQPQETPVAKPTKQAALPPKLHMELANNIGEDQIPNFVTFLKSELNMQPFRFMMQPNRLKREVMARAFPHWLEAHGLT